MKVLYGDLKNRSDGGNFAKFLCSSCGRRNSAVQDAPRAAAAAAWEHEELFYQYKAWLREAPPLGNPSALPGWDPLRHRIESLDLETMAEDFAAGRRRLLNGGPIGTMAAAVGFDYRQHASPPSTYQNVLTYNLEEPPVEITTYLGSIYRQDDGRVAIHWRTYMSASRSGVQFY